MATISKNLKVYICNEVIAYFDDLANVEILLHCKHFSEVIYFI